MIVSAIRLYELLKKKIGQEEAEVFVAILDTTVAILDTTVDKKFEEKKDFLLTQKDKAEMMNRLDSHFKWLVGIMIALLSISVALIKFI